MQTAIKILNLNIVFKIMFNTKINGKNTISTKYKLTKHSDLYFLKTIKLNINSKLNTRKC